MGGTSYDRDVGSVSSSGRFDSGGVSSDGAKNALSRRFGSQKTNPRGKTIVSQGKASIVIVLDVTGSNIEFARIVYDKAPMLYGQIEQQGYLPADFDIAFVACGDANSDDFPLQVTDFAKGIALDDHLKELYLEGHGGGQTCETYALAAYYLANFSQLPNSDIPVCCIIADESPYDFFKRGVASEILGIELQENIASKVVFEELLRVYKGNVFVFLNPYGGRRNPEDSVSVRIYEDWCRIFGRREQVIKILEEKSIVDMILGVIAMVSRKRDLAGYLTDMANRGQTPKRLQNVASALDGVSKAIVPVSGQSNLPAVPPTVKRTSGGKRL